MSYTGNHAQGDRLIRALLDEAVPNLLNSGDGRAWTHGSHARRRAGHASTSKKSAGSP